MNQAPEPRAIAQVPLEVPEATPRQVQWYRLPSGLRAGLLIIGPILIALSLLVLFVCLAIGAFHWVLLVPLLLGLLVMVRWPVIWKGKRRADSVFRHGLRARAEILSVTPKGADHVVDYRFWDEAGTPHEDRAVVSRAVRPVFVGPTTAVIDPWDSARAILPELYPVAFAETGVKAGVPPAPRGVAFLHSVKPPRPVRPVLSIVLLLVTLGFFLTPSLVPAAAIMVAAALALVLFVRWRFWRKNKRVRKVAQWGRRRRLEVLSVEPPGDLAYRAATVRFLDVDDPAPTKVKLEARAGWEPTPGETLLALVEVGFGVGGRRKLRPMVVLPDDDYLRFAAHRPEPRPTTLPARGGFRLPADQTLGLHAQAYPIPGVPDSAPKSLEIDTHEIRLCIDGRPLTRIDGGRPFHLDVGCWTRDPATMDVCVTLRQEGQRLDVRVSLPNAAVRADVPDKQSRAPWLQAADFGPFWTWVQAHAEASGRDTGQLAVPRESTHQAQAQA